MTAVSGDNVFSNIFVCRTWS